MITFRDAKVFLSGMITAFVLALIVYNANLGQQQLIAEGVTIAVVTSVIVLISSITINIIFSIFNKSKKIGA